MEIQTEPDEAPGSPLPDWLKNYIGFLKPARTPGSYNWPYFEFLNQHVAEIAQVNITDLGFVPIHTLSRRSHLITSGDDSYFLFDCLHAATLRMLYYHVTIGAAQEQILYLIKEHVASCLLALENDTEALALLDENIPFLYFNTLPKPPYFYFELAKKNQSHLPKVPFTEAFPLIDSTKSCHEILHFLIRQGHSGAMNYVEVAREQFDLVVDSIYPEKPTDAHMEEMLNNMDLLVDFSENAAVGYQDEFVKMFLERRAGLIAMRDSLIEDIACDMFALRAVLLW
ncbi:MAG TPA: hypothetical protein VFQ47_08015 [Nitrososphaera sp.]|jgi:hypothetical protein|nr:hypothetical protein [Nitrososphaera sp.]